MYIQTEPHFHSFFVDTSWDTLSDITIKTRANKSMTSQKIRQYHGEVLHFVDVQVTDEDRSD